MYLNCEWFFFSKLHACNPKALCLFPIPLCTQFISISHFPSLYTQEKPLDIGAYRGVGVGIGLRIRPCWGLLCRRPILLSHMVVVVRRQRVLGLVGRVAPLMVVPPAARGVVVVVDSPLSPILGVLGGYRGDSVLGAGRVLG